MDDDCLTVPGGLNDKRSVSNVDLTDIKQERTPKMVIRHKNTLRGMDTSYCFCAPKNQLLSVVGVQKKNFGILKSSNYFI